jgi:hypothetical protein
MRLRIQRAFDWTNKVWPIRLGLGYERSHQQPRAILYDDLLTESAAQSRHDRSRREIEGASGFGSNQADGSSRIILPDAIPVQDTMAPANTTKAQAAA